MIKRVFYLLIYCIFVLMADPKPDLRPSDSELSISSEDLPYREFTDGNDAIAWWDSIYGSRIFTQEERQIIYDYTSGNFIFINDVLRKGVPISKLTKDEQLKVGRLDMALSKTYIFENLIVYRYETLGFFTRLISSDIVFNDI